MCAPDAPDPPDYAGAAQQQGIANLEAALATAKLSNPSFTNPTGSRSVTFSPQNTVNVVDTLAPAQQRMFDTENTLQQNLLDTGVAGLGRVSAAMSTPFDMSKVQTVTTDPSAGGQQAIIDALMARQQPLFDRRRQQEQDALIQQGHTRGGTAWDAAADDRARAENDAFQAAILSAGQEQSRLFDLESSGRNRDIQEQTFLRQLPLNEVNALRTGNQATLPQFQSYSGANVNAAPVFQGAQATGQAQQNIYNQQVAGNNAMWGGLFDLGGAALGVPRFN